MARTVIENGNDLSPIIVQKKMFLDQVKNSFFSKFMSANGDSIVHTKEDFTKMKGDTMTFGIIYRSTGAPIRGSDVAKGKEDKLVTKSFKIEIDITRYPMDVGGSMDNQRFVGDLPSSVRTNLNQWGSEQIDQDIFDAVSTSPTYSYLAGARSGTDALTTADKITPSDISKMKAIALNNRESGRIPMRPIMCNGQKHLVLVISSDCAVDLKLDSTYIAANREARERSKDNPIFTGALGVWDNVIIFEHENVKIYENGGSGEDVKYSHNILMGAQAVCLAWGDRPSIRDEESDYGEIKGLCWRMVNGTEKPVFDSKDFGSMAYYCADSRSTLRTGNTR